MYVYIVNRHIYIYINKFYLRLRGILTGGNLF